MTRTHLLSLLLRGVLGFWLLVAPSPAWGEPPPPGKEPPPPHAEEEELAPWVRPVQYVSGVVLVIGIGLLIYLRTRKPKPPA